MFVETSARAKVCASTLEVSKHHRFNRLRSYLIPPRSEAETRPAGRSAVTTWNESNIIGSRG
eukprot:1392848-Pyramimonas_sp.AAC.1